MKRLELGIVALVAVCLVYLLVPAGPGAAWTSPVSPVSPVSPLPVVWWSPVDPVPCYSPGCGAPAGMVATPTPTALPVEEKRAVPTQAPAAGMRWTVEDRALYREYGTNVSRETSTGAAWQIVTCEDPAQVAAVCVCFADGAAYCGNAGGD